MTPDTWIHRISRRLVRPLRDTRVTPNHLTTARLVTGVGAAACFLVDDWNWDALGAAIFVVSMLLDRADGELARMTGATSRFGASYDLVTDAISNACAFLALGVAALDGGLGFWGLPVGIVAGLSISTIFVLMISTENRYGNGTARYRARAGFDPDDALILVPIGVLLGQGDILLISAGICAPLVALFIGHDLYRRRRRLAAADKAAAHRLLADGPEAQ